MLIREIRSEDLAGFAKVFLHAYPGVKRTREQMIEFFEQKVNSETSQILIAVDHRERILGGYIFYEFDIYQNYNQLKMGGVGSVCVALDAKKAGVAKALLLDSLNRMQQKNIPTSILYPFRHDFYQSMGWGQVGEIKETAFNPASLPRDDRRRAVRRSTEQDKHGLEICYEKFARPGNCLAKRSLAVWENKLKTRDLFVYDQDEQIQGYLQVSFDLGNSFLKNTLKIDEFVYTTQDAYFGLLGFIASQLDQFPQAVYYSSRNDPFHLLLKEPRRADELIYGLYHYCQRVGVGWMFRLVDVQGALSNRVNYHGADLEVSFDIQDSFLPENNGIYRLVLQDGKPEVVKGQSSRQQIKVDISVFAQLFTNYLTFSQANQLGKIQTNDPRILGELDRAFSLVEPMMLEFY